MIQIERRWVAVTGAMLAGGAALAQPVSGRAVEAFPSPSGPAFDAVMDGPTVYYAGRFDAVGPATSGFRMLDAETGEDVGRAPGIERSVRGCVPDGTGGYYIGGEMVMSTWGGAYGGLFRFGPDGERRACGDLRTSSNGGVFAMAASGASVIVAGRFEHDGVQNLAIIDRSSGAIRPVAVDANDTVWGIAVRGDVAYVCGAFTTIGGQPRQGTAAIRVSSGEVLPWTADLTVTSFAVPYAIAISGESVYIGGNSLVTPSGQRPLVRVALATGAFETPEPVISGSVGRLAAGEGAMYMVGSLLRVNGEWRDGVAAFDPVTGGTLSWAPVTDRPVRDLSVDSGRVYLSGDFTTVGGQARAQLAAVSPTTGSLLAWNPRGRWGGASSSQAFVRGLGAVVATRTDAVVRDPVSRSCLAAVDIPTRQVLPLSHQFSYGGNEASIYQIAKSGDWLYASGQFNSVDGIATPSGFGAVRLSTDRWESLDRLAGIATIHRFAGSGDRLYVMGEGGSLSTYSLAAIDMGTRRVLWSVPVNGVAEEIVVSEDGSQVAINNVGAGFVRIYTSAGVAQWVINDPGRAVQDLAIHCGKLLIGTNGSITANGRTSRGLAVVSLADGRLIAPSITLGQNAGVRRVTGMGPAALISGWFDAVNGVAADRAAAVDLRRTSRLMDWRPSGFYVERLASSSGGAVGVFNGATAFDGVWCQSIAVFEASCEVDVNLDGFIDCFDYIDFVTCFETEVCTPGKTADFNGDGFVDMFDYMDFVVGFEEGC